MQSHVRQFLEPNFKKLVETRAVATGKTRYVYGTRGRLWSTNAPGNFHFPNFKPLFFPGTFDARIF